MTVSLGDFHAKSSNWYKHDKTSYEGAKFEALVQHLGLQKTTDEPSHILAESSCIDLIFTSNQGLVMDSGVHQLLYSNYHHHQIA